MTETISDIELKLEWNRVGDHMKVLHKGKVVYNTGTGIVSPLLSPRQVKWIEQDYNRKRKQYVFA